MKRYYADRMMVDIQNSDNPLQVAKECIKEYRLFYELLMYNFIPELKFDLDEGVPSYKSMQEITDLSFEHLLQMIKKFKYFVGPKKLQKEKREEMYVRMLETLSQTEAYILIFLKDQKLEELYPKINIELFNNLR